MYSTTFLFRTAKLASVFAIGVMALLIVIGNTTDYYSNYHFVEHVLKMDTIFPGSSLRYRHIDSPVLFHAGYIFLILLEALMSFCCLWGSWRLLRALKSDAAGFHAAKNWAVAGLLLGLMIWFFGFEVVGGEWFAMWQSSTWNGLGAAERIVSFLGLTLVLLHLPEEPARG
jgi:predicted small integral membrane protein